MNIDAVRLLHLIHCLEARDAGPMVDDVLRAAGSDRPDAKRPGTFSYKEEALVVRAASHALDDITFGADAGLRMVELNNLTAYISKYSRNLRSAIENVSRFHELIDPAFAFALREADDVAVLEVAWKDASYARYHRHTEFVIFAALARMRYLTRTNLNPIEIRFDHEVRNSAEQFQKLAGFPVIFTAQRPAIVLSPTSLDLPIPTYDPRLKAHLIDYGERLLKERVKPEQKLKSRVEGLLTAALPSKMLSADDVASELGMTTRTLARRLSEDGNSFRDIVDDLRCDLAKTFLKDQMVLSEIAFALGYSDQAAFSTAFKRWTGTAPSEFRAGGA